MLIDKVDRALTSKSASINCIEMANLADLNIENRLHATIKGTQRLTPIDSEEVREILLEVEPLGIEFELNQGVGVLVDISDESGTHIHHRLYSIADIQTKENDTSQLTILVRRCSYVDPINGKRYDGIASNYLCDRKVGDQITITGPHSLPFTMPADSNANLIMIGMGTGIAPFRAFVKHIYQHQPNWKGKIRLFYGAKSGLELLYLNEKKGDLTNYYDEETFNAFSALSPRPHWSDPITLDRMIVDRATEIINMLSSSNTYIYVSGHAKVRDMLDKAFALILGSEEKWESYKAKLKVEKRWAELIY